MARPVDLSDFLSLVLWTAYVKRGTGGDKTVSCMLVASVESGKTSIVEQFIENNGVFYATNCTEYGLLTLKREEMTKGIIKHIVIPDFIKTLNQKKDTVNNLITFFNSYIEEGVRTIASYSYNIDLAEPMRGGIITTIAIMDYQRMQKTLAACGFLSRLMILSFSYDTQHIQQIFQDIAFGKKTWQPTILNFPAEPVEVNLDGNVASQLIFYSQKIGERLKSTGFRAQHNFQSLAKAAALSEGRDIVTLSDVNRVIQYATDYVGLQYHKIGLDGRVNIAAEKEAAKDAKSKQGRLLVGV